MPTPTTAHRGQQQGQHAQDVPRGGGGGGDVSGGGGSVMATGGCCVSNFTPGGCWDGGISTTGCAAPARYNLLPHQPEWPGIPLPPGVEGWGRRDMVVKMWMWREEIDWRQIRKKDKDSQHSRKRTETKTNKQKGKAASTEDLPFWKNRQKLAIKKRWKKKVKL
jgi:hypothetical protein